MECTINIVTQSNGVGLDRDANILSTALIANGYDVTLSSARGISVLNHWLPSKNKYRINLFLERVFPRWIRSADVNILIPNQERFPKRHLARLKMIDYVFCKSRHALEIFSKHHRGCHYLGFTSLDFYDEQSSTTHVNFLHLAGRSTLKGTETVLKLWHEHPEWPPLTLLQNRDKLSKSVPDNIYLISEYLDDSRIKRLYNEHLIHICPSRSEGWGHYIVEAMACKRVVVTTDGPPMNEIIAAGRGIVIDVERTEGRHLGTNYYVDPRALETAIETIITSSESSIKELGDAARDWMLHNHEEFVERLVKLVNSVQN